MNHNSLHLPKCNRCNFAMQTLFNRLIISRLQNLMQFLYGYSSNSPKNHLEFTQLTLIMKTKDNKILWNVKTCWIPMFLLWRKFFEIVGPFDEDGFKCIHYCLGYLKSQSIMWCGFIFCPWYVSFPCWNCEFLGEVCPTLWCFCLTLWQYWIFVKLISSCMWTSLWLSMTNFLGILWVGGNQPW